MCDLGFPAGARAEQAPIVYELDVVRLEAAANPRLRTRIERDGVRIFS
jgi:hypothetical protein